MEYIIGIVLGSSLIIGVIGFIWGVIVAFRKSIFWGLISLFLAPGGVIAFLVMTWRDNYRPLILVLQAVVVVIVVILISA